MKSYVLIWYCNGLPQQIMTGSPALLNFKKEQLKKEAHFKNGRFTIISEQGFKHNYNYIK